MLHHSFGGAVIFLSLWTPSLISPSFQGGPTIPQTHPFFKISNGKQTKARRWWSRSLPSARFINIILLCAQNNSCVFNKPIINTSLHGRWLNLRWPTDNKKKKKKTAHSSKLVLTGLVLFQASVHLGVELEDGSDVIDLVQLPVKTALELVQGGPDLLDQVKR